MDQILEKVFSSSKTLDTIKIEKDSLRNKLERDLVLNFNGGSFIVDHSLIAFLKQELESSDLIILDKNNIPIKINDVMDFYIDVRSCYFEAVTEYYEKYEELKKRRKVIDIMQIKKEEK